MQEASSVVIADDDKDMLQLCGRTLRNAGFNVHLVANGRDVLQTVHANQAAIVVLDVVFPHTSGLKILSQLRREKSTQNIPVLMLTGSDSVFTMSESMDRGAAGYITKPIAPRRLVDIVRAHLAGGTTRGLHLSRQPGVRPPSE